MGWSFFGVARKDCVDNKVSVRFVQRPVFEEQALVDSAEDHVRDVVEVQIVGELTVILRGLQAFDCFGSPWF